MKSVKTYGAAMLLTALAAVASAQVSKTLPGTMEIVTVTVESIEKASREVTIKKPDGSYGVFSVSEDIKRFDTLKVGDKITAKYYENIVLRLKAPGEKDVDSDNAAITKSAKGAAGTAPPFSPLDGIRISRMSARRPTHRVRPAGSAPAGDPTGRSRGSAIAAGPRERRTSAVSG